jgi:hypothetical protein
MGMKEFKSKIFSLQNLIHIRIATFNLSHFGSLNMQFVGNDYSGYWFPQDLIPSKGTIWGVGLGFDSSFESQMGISGYKILGFEPVLEASDYAERELAHVNGKIYPWGLWDRSGNYESFGDSVSIVNLFENVTGNNDSLEIRNIYEVAEVLDLKNQSVPRVLKLNIEGAEQEILLALVQSPLPFEIIIFQAEFLLHLSFLSARKKLAASLRLRKIISGLRMNGYQLIHIGRNQFTFMRETE